MAARLISAHESALWPIHDLSPMCGEKTTMRAGHLFGVARLGRERMVDRPASRFAQSIDRRCCATKRIVRHKGLVHIARRDDGQCKSLGLSLKSKDASWSKAPESRC
jgi:hypothetical protein